MMKQRLFRLFSAVPTLYRPLIGGGSCALAAAIGSPQSLAVGYSTLNRIISGDLKNPLMLSNFMVCLLVCVSYIKIVYHSKTPLVVFTRSGNW